MDAGVADRVGEVIAGEPTSGGTSSLRRVYIDNAIETATFWSWG